mmetsp:Transcript_105701/g.303778  ORF Transcript_105701/g.303778 Transcript_105701/m.303778 type:complete len:228 (-) Transcript_105701:19-702(-)
MAIRPAMTEKRRVDARAKGKRFVSEILPVLRSKLCENTVPMATMAPSAVDIEAATMPSKYHPPRKAFMGKWSSVPAAYPPEPSKSAKKWHSGLLQVSIFRLAYGSGFHSPQVGTPGSGTALQVLLRLGSAAAPPKQPITVMVAEQELATNSACGEDGPYKARVVPALNVFAMPMVPATMPAMMQPIRAALPFFAEKQRAWKSKAMQFPKAKTMTVTQLKKTAFGTGS